MTGKTTWWFPVGDLLEPVTGGRFTSHESLMVLNPNSDRATALPRAENLTLIAVRKELASSRSGGERVCGDQARVSRASAYSYLSEVGTRADARGVNNN
jgi:hypothetical protein